MTDLIGFLAAAAGTAAALLLAFPLFHLLRAHTAIDDLERKLDAPNLADDVRTEILTSLYDLKLHVRKRRRVAVAVAVAGVTLVVLATLFLVWQGILLFG